VVGAAGGVAWAGLTEPAAYQVTRDGAYLDEHSLGQVFNTDGWFLVIEVALGCVAGGAMTYAWRRHGWVVVLAVLAGSCLAGAVAYLLGHALGPGDLDPRLAAATPGEQVPVPLTVKADGVYFAWPVGAMLGAVLAVVAWNRQDPAAVQPVEVPRLRRRTSA
jgi:adenine/guanine phosphoribosyltransferase-like PRPP-binding protein